MIRGIMKRFCNIFLVFAVTLATCFMLAGCGAENAPSLTTTQTTGWNFAYSEEYKSSRDCFTDTQKAYKFSYKASGDNEEVEITLAQLLENGASVSGLYVTSKTEAGQPRTFVISYNGAICKILYEVA